MLGWLRKLVSNWRGKSTPTTTAISTKTSDPQKTVTELPSSQIKELLVPREPKPVIPPRPAERPEDSLYGLMLGLRPTCDVCNRPVEGMTMISQNAAGKSVVLVDCHGDTQRLEIDPRDVKFARGGRAFRPGEGEAADILHPGDLHPQHRKQLEEGRRKLGFPPLKNRINRDELL